MYQFDNLFLRNTFSLFLKVWKLHLRSNLSEYLFHSFGAINPIFPFSKLDEALGMKNTWFYLVSYWWWELNWNISVKKLGHSTLINLNMNKTILYSYNSFTFIIFKCWYSGAGDSLCHRCPMDKMEYVV